MKPRVLKGIQKWAKPRLVKLLRELMRDNISLAEDRHELLETLYGIGPQWAEVVLDQDMKAGMVVRLRVQATFRPVPEKYVEWFRVE